MDNPYAAPMAEPPAADWSRRPVGVTVLSFLTALLGIALLAAFIVVLGNRREINEFVSNHHMAPSIFWFFSSTSVVITFGTAIGMWRARKWGWWIACCGFVLFIVNNIASTAMVNFAANEPSIQTFASVDSLKFVVRGTIAAAILAYWLSSRVRTYFHVERTGRIKAICLSAACGIGITTIVTIVLQTVLLMSSR
jgi:hypothetical protein